MGGWGVVTEEWREGKRRGEIIGHGACSQLARVQVRGFQNKKRGGGGERERKREKKEKRK